ncbi:hypothetical protein [Autumnicola musiva]|uniref:GLPGLI family protein n=1 Tax=Autumnicola musiva TaxID=3075589 RepID=A0ABU3D4I3_9FLAO|nr:hypothetical protein [Zunongwangia sp. F117]MDT0675948.1 hypothetical protein [Zunongwangia sp. F117]
MKHLIYFLLIINFSALAQDSITKSKSQNKRYYIPLKQYVQAGNELTAQDSANFMYRNNDTLVEVSENFFNNIGSKRDGKRVKYEFKDSTFLKIYKNVVYNQSKNSSNETMKIWKDDIKIYFDSSVPVSHQAILINFSAELSTGIDSLNIRKAASKEDSNLQVYYLNGSNSDEQFEPRMADQSSAYYVYWNGKQQLNKGFIKIDPKKLKNEKYQIAHLKFQFFKILGRFYSSSNLDCKSYLSNCKTIRKLTTIDQEILKYHYSYGICKGVNLKDFEELHARNKALLKEHPNAQIYVVHNE